MRPLHVLTVLSLSAFALPAQAPAEAGGKKPVATSPAAARFKELAEAQSARVKAAPRDSREAFQKAMTEIAVERAKDLTGFLETYATGPEATKARIEFGQLAQQNKELTEQAKTTLAALDLKDADLKTTIQASMVANTLGLAEQKAAWIDAAKQKAKSMEDRLELVTALSMGMKDKAQADALMTETEKSATTDDDRATLMMHKATQVKRASRDNKEAYQEALAEVVKLYPKTKVGQLAAGKLAAAKMAVGGDPVAFTTKDMAGKDVSPAAYKGKVLLMDFWATWCGPCMAELPHVLDAYEKHHANGFEILGISLDRADDKAKLESTIQEKGMSWRHVYDGKFWQAEIAQLYDVNSIPFTVLIGKDGKVAGTNLRGAALEKAVAEALAK